MTVNQASPQIQVFKDDIKITATDTIIAKNYYQHKCIRSLRSRCFDTVFQKPQQQFSIALKVFFSLYDRYKTFTSNWLWIEICENVVLGKIDITMTTINKKIEIDKGRILCDLG